MEMDEIDLQIDCLRIKLDALKVQEPKWALDNSLGMNMAISPCISINFQYHALYFQNLKPVFSFEIKFIGTIL